MRRIIRSVRALTACTLAFVAIGVARPEASPSESSAPSAPTQFPGMPDSSLVPPDQRNLPDEPLGPGPEVGNEPSEPPPGQQTPPPETVPNPSARADTLGTVADTSFAAPSGVVKPAPELLDTLSLPAGPTPTNSSAPPGVSAPHAPPPAAELPPKPRTGVLGIHPAAILIGLAALNYFIIKWATN